MARVTNLSESETRTLREVVDPLITDYLSATQTTQQSVAGDLNLASGKVIKYNGSAIGATGPKGDKGDTGATGATGAAGANGTNGTNGTNGYTWYSGSGAPSSGAGVNGDYYLNTTSYDVYLKAAGSWSVICNIKGATGAVGSSYGRSYKFLVRKEGSVYNTYDSDGALIAGSGTSSMETAVVDEAFAGLTGSRNNKETVKLQGSFTADDSIPLIPNLNLDLYEAYFIIPTNFAKPLFTANTTVLNALTDYDPVHISVCGGKFNGNYANQASTACEFIKISGCTRHPRQWIFKDNYIEDCRGYGLNFADMGNIDLNGVRIDNGNTHGYGISFDDIWDSNLSNLQIDCYETPLNMTDDVRTNDFSHFYIGGGTCGVLNGSYNNHFNDLRAQDNYGGGLELTNATGNTFTGGHFYGNSGASDGTISAIVLAGSSNRNSVIGVSFPDNSPSATAKYTIEEKDTADYNTFIGNTRAAAVGALHKIGANSIDLGNQ